MRTFAETFVIVAPYFMMVVLYHTLSRRIDRLWKVVESIADALNAIDRELDIK